MLHFDNSHPPHILHSKLMRYLVTKKRTLCQTPAHNISNLGEHSQAYVTIFQPLNKRFQLLSLISSPPILCYPSLKSMDRGTLEMGVWHPREEKMLTRAGFEERLAQSY